MDSLLPCILINIVVPTTITSHHEAVEKILYDAVLLYVNTEYSWYDATVCIEHTDTKDNELISVDVLNTTTYNRIIIKNSVFALVCRLINASTTKLWNGANATVDAIVVLPETWSSQMITDFYDMFYGRIEVAYPKCIIGQIKVITTSVVPGQSVIAIVRNAPKVFEKDAENVIQHIGEMICRQIESVNKMLLL